MTPSIRNLMVLLAVFCMLGLAQQPREIITNKEVIEMLRAKVPEPTILAAIELAAARGLTNFETSTQTIIELRKLGASGDILNAMMVAPRMRRPAAPPPPSPVPGLPEQRGVYYQTSSGFTALPIDVFWPDHRGTWKYFTGFGAQHWTFEISGAQGRMRISDRRPVFYLRGMDADAAHKILRLASRHERREVNASERLPYELRFASADAHGYQITRISHDIIRLQPAADLTPGEYVLTSPGAPGQKYLMLAAEFGIGN